MVFNLITKKFFKAVLFFLLLLIFVGLFFKNSAKRELDFGNLVNVCDRSEQKMLCWKENLERVVVDYDLDVAFDLLDAWYKNDSDFAVNCHDFTHLLGKKAYELFSVGNDFKITPKTSYCSYGFYHGFMDNLAGSSGNYLEAKDFCNYVDSQLSTQTPDVSLQCFHGMGHGWVNVHDEPSVWGNVDLILKPALELCRKVSSNISQQSRCATGAYNGVVLFMIENEYGMSINKTDPMEVCARQPQEFKDACYISMNILLMTLTEGDLTKATKFIETIEDDVIANHAMINLSALSSLPSLKENNGYQQQIKLCRSLEKRLQDACLKGYAYGFMENGEPGEEYFRPLEFCGLEELNNEERNACYSYIFSYIPQWYPEEKAVSICETLDESLSAECKKMYTQISDLNNENKQ